jgi:hypothetical protein
VLRAVASIIVIVAVCEAIAVLTLRLVGIHTPLAYPIDAGGLAVVAATVGTLPLMLARDTDAAALMQRALLGTVLHMFTATGLAIALIVTHAAGMTQLIFWVFGGYLISLLLVVSQLRRKVKSRAPSVITNTRLTTN